MGADRERRLDFVPTEEQQLLGDQVRALCEEHTPPETLRNLITDNAPWRRELWDHMGELGLLGAAIPEACGGVGLGPMELAVINREIGRAVAPVPFFSSACMAAEAIRLAGTPEQQARWLPDLAAGRRVATFAWAEPSATLMARPLATSIDGNRIRGAKTPVPDAALASLCVVLADRGGGDCLAVVELDQHEVERKPLNGFDQLRHHAAIELRGARCEVLQAKSGSGPIRALFDEFATLLAFEQVGGAEAALYMARDYTLERYIFGRRLGSYQAVKHKLADILVALELAHANALCAMETLESGGRDSRIAAATARIGATEAYETAARENLQLHGGIGFTWEANCHFHYRRARLLALSLGSVEVWSDMLIDALAETASPSRAA